LVGTASKSGQRFSDLHMVTTPSERAAIARHGRVATSALD
jgi:hypothetical protein